MYSLKQLIEERQGLMNSDNHLGSLSRVTVEQRTSKKEGNKPYYVLTTYWNMPGVDDPYACELFLTAEQYMLMNLSKPLDAARNFGVN